MARATAPLVTYRSVLASDFTKLSRFRDLFARDHDQHR